MSTICQSHILHELAPLTTRLRCGFFELRNSPKGRLTLHIETPGRVWTFCPVDSTKCPEWVERIKEVANVASTESFDATNTKF